MNAKQILPFPRPLNHPALSSTLILNLRVFVFFKPLSSQGRGGHMEMKHVADTD